MPSEYRELKTKNYRAVAGSKIIARVAGIWNEKYGLALVGFNWVWGAQSQLFCPSLSPQAIYSKQLARGGGFECLKYPVFSHMVALKTKPKHDLIDSKPHSGFGRSKKR